MQAIASAIDAAARKLGGQKHLAAELGVHSNTISGWKRGVRGVGTEQLVRIYEINERSMDEDFGLKTAGSGALSEERVAERAAELLQARMVASLLGQPLPPTPMLESEERLAGRMQPSAEKGAKKAGKRRINGGKG